MDRIDYDYCRTGRLTSPCRHYFGHRHRYGYRYSVICETMPRPVCDRCGNC